MLARGFSLTELMVVMAIVAITAMIVFPVYANSREKARQAVCQVNLRQLGVALQLYAEDYDDMLPGRRKGWGLIPGHKETTWPLLIYRYTLKPSVYLCRSFLPYTTPDNFECSYGINACVAGDYIGRAQSAIDLPSERVLMMDAFCCGTGSPFCSCPGIDRSHVYPHNGGANCLYADGHIAWHSEGYLRLHWELFDVRYRP